jgi:peptidoglycan hydrolase CwlO-like protein
MLPKDKIFKKFFMATGMFSFVILVAILAMRISPITNAQTATSTDTGNAQQQIDANNQQIATLNQQIATYEAEIKQTGADKKTLQAAINALDLQRKKIQSQVAVTQDQINVTQLQIKQLGSAIMGTQETIVSDEAALEGYLRNLQKADDEPLIVRVLKSGTLVNAWTDVNETLQMQAAVQKQWTNLQTQKSALANSQAATQQKKTILTSQEQSLTSQQKSLATSVQSKSQLLAQTKAQESNYQKLLNAAKSQLASFSAFAQNAGGSKLLANQTICDSWGCYYNQRDIAWGSQALNGTQYRLASDGCLVTAMAMVMTHYGYKDVTPAMINADPNNFATYYPAYLLFTINVDGVSATRKSTSIDATLATGDPVIVGINAYGGTHFVVLVSGSNGNYTMRDPYIANGKDISFTANYSLRNIFAISKVQIS